MTDTAPPAPAPRRSAANRWLAIGLIVSVAINLAFIGWGATRMAGFHRMSPRTSDQVEEQIARRLPEHAAHAFREAMDHARKGNKASFQQMRYDIAQALATEPYDRARLEALLRQHRQRMDQFQQSLQAGLLAAADAMTPEERKAYAERMLRHGPPRHRPSPPPADAREDGSPPPPGR
ncbi:MAG TPA: periplasmic heavy metal sensor [Ferrovibrio sp.]|uniref:periplasmic heavy metal sensor n=1 Tax=Ferrovibrio sp. TaxID=1917215 RepID=UPI002ED2B235